jgi:nicotinamidase-related amidase
VQNDFVDGALGSPEAQEAAKKVAQLVADEKWDEVIATVDHHHPKPFLRTVESEKMPPHCIAYSPGAALYGDIIPEHVDHVIAKSNFSVDVKDIWPYLQRTSEEASAEIELFICGLCTDVCVISNALMLRSEFPHIKITVLADACAGTSPEKHKAALAVMESCLIDIKSS